MKRRRLADKTAPRSHDDRTSDTPLLRAALGRRDTFGRTHPINELRILPGRGGFRL